MPVNSFDDYPMTWKPDSALLKFPIYASLAGLLEQDIVSGKLSPNTKLPPQRELADFLDINLSTVTHAFRICETKGLIYARVGCGTFVSPGASLPKPNTSGSLIELGVINPYSRFNGFAAEAAANILQRSDAGRLFSFTLGTAEHKAAARKWLSKFHIDAENILLTSGTQNALAVTLLALFKSGDSMAADVYTYSNFSSLAKQLNIRLIPIEGDSLGMLPDALERQCRLSDIKGVYLMPSCSNPTAISMPTERRKALGRVISKRDMILIEDDTYGFLSDGEPPISAEIPSVYIHGISKSLATGLRIAYMVFPQKFSELFAHTFNNINLKIPLFNAEIATSLINSGAADEIVKNKRRLSAERTEIYKKYFKNCSNTRSLFQWLPIPSGSGGYDFELRAQAAGVNVLCSDRFAIGNTNGFSAVRIATCSPDSNEELDTGLRIIKSLIDESIKASCGLII